LFTSLGLLFASGGVLQPIIVLKAVGVMFSAAVFVYSLNDSVDADLDKSSSIKSKRPIPSGMMTKRQGLLLSVVGALISLSLSITINFLTITFVIVFMVLGFLYSVPPIRLKRRFLMKESVLITGMIISTLIGSATMEKIPSSLFLPVLYFVLMGSTFIPAFIDAVDVEQDRKEGCKTIAMILDQKTRLELATLSVFITMITITLSYGYFNLNIICPIVTVFSSLLFLRYLFPLLLKPEESYSEEIIFKAANINRIFGFIIILGLMFGSLALY